MLITTPSQPNARVAENNCIWYAVGIKIIILFIRASIIIVVYLIIVNYDSTEVLNSPTSGAHSTHQVSLKICLDK